jgi:hypothetical protein
MSGWHGIRFQGMMSSASIQHELTNEEDLAVLRACQHAGDEGPEGEEEAKNRIGHVTGGFGDVGTKIVWM